MDSNILDIVLAAWNGAVAEGISSLRPLALLFLGVAAVAAMVTALMSVIGHEPVTYLIKVSLVVVVLITINLLILRWQGVSDTLANTAIRGGLLMSGNRLTWDEFYSPGWLAARGAEITRPIDRFLEKFGIWDSITKPFHIAVMGVMSMIIAALWVAAAMNVFMSIFVYKFLAPIALLGVAFMIAPATRAFGFGLVRLLLGGAMQLFSLAAWTSLVTVAIPWMVLAAQQTSPRGIPSLWMLVLLCVMSFFFMVFGFIVPLVAAAGAYVASGTSAVRSALRV